MAVFSRIAAQLDLMQEMFRQTGAFNKTVHSTDQPPSLRQAMYSCSKCGNTDACRKWLDIGLEGKLDNRDAPGFCPNQALQNGMKLEHGA